PARPQPGTRPTWRSPPTAAGSPSPTAERGPGRSWAGRRPRPPTRGTVPPAAPRPRHSAIPLSPGLSLFPGPDRASRTLTARPAGRARDTTPRSTSPPQRRATTQKPLILEVATGLGPLTGTGQRAGTGRCLQDQQGGRRAEARRKGRGRAGPRGGGRRAGAARQIGAGPTLRAGVRAEPRTPFLVPVRAEAPRRWARDRGPTQTDTGPRRPNRPGAGGRGLRPAGRAP